MSVQIPGFSSAQAELGITPFSFPTNFPVVDTFALNGIPVPGRWTLLDTDRTFGWKINLGSYMTGAWIQPGGDPPIEPKFRGEFFNSGEYGDFRAFRNQFFKKGSISIGGALVSASMSIYHPELHDLHCSSVVLADHSAAQNEGAGLWVVKLHFIEWKAPLPIGPRPNGTLPPAPNAQVDANTALTIENQQLNAQTQAALAQAQSIGAL